jgi:hypothetical protein
MPESPVSEPGLHQPRRPSRAIKALAVACVSLASLVFGELCLRVVDHDVYLQRRLRDGGLLIPFEPGVKAELVADEFRALYEINGFGYRDRLDRRAERLPGRRRLLLLGDSFSAGWGVDFEQTYGARLEQALGCDVVNAAKNGGCPLWFVHQARHATALFEPDALVVQVFDNDLSDNLRDRRKIGGAPGQPTPALDARYQPREDLVAKLKRGFNGLVLRRRLRALQRRVLKGRAVHRQPYVERGARAARAVLTRAEAIARHAVDFGAAPSFEGDFAFLGAEASYEWSAALSLQGALLRELISECRARGTPILLVYIPAQQIFWGPERAAQLARNSHRRALVELCTELSVPLLDFSAELARDEQPERFYYAYDGHLNEAGHAHLAELLGRSIERHEGALFGSADASTPR